MSGFGRVACQGFLVREACKCVPVGGAGFLRDLQRDLECNEVSSNEL